MKGKSRPVLSLAIGTVLALASAEALLWILGGFLGTEERIAGVGSGPAILCIGDSNTYGIHLEAEDSYPGQLQAYLDASGQRFTVVNQGCPGLNTTQVRLGLEETIEDVDPVAVVVFAGVNDRWSNAGRPVWSGEEPRLGSTLLASSRVLKLMRLVLVAESSADATSFEAGLETAREERLSPDGFPPAPENSGNKTSEVTRTSIRTNLEAIASLCRARDTAVVFVGYPNYTDGVREDVNAAIQETAKDLGVPYVDLASRFRSLVETLRTILYIPRDSHLSAVGNHEAARQVLLALRAAEVVRADPPPPSIEEAYGALGLTREPGGEETALALTGPPGWVWRLRLVGLYAAPKQPGGVRRAVHGLEESGLAKRQLDGWRGKFDPSGEASTRLELPPTPENESFMGWEVLALATAPDYAVLAKAKGDPRGVRFSPSLEFSR